MNSTFYFWSVMFIVSALTLVLILINTITMRRFYKGMGVHIEKKLKESDRRICDEIELVEYTDEECGRNK